MKPENRNIVPRFCALFSIGSKVPAGLTHRSSSSAVGRRWSRRLTNVSSALEAFRASACADSADPFLPTACDVSCGPNPEMVGTPPDAFASGVFAHPTPDQKFNVSLLDIFSQ